MVREELAHTAAKGVKHFKTFITANITADQPEDIWTVFIAGSEEIRILQSFFFREREDFFCVKLRGILLGLLLIPVLFYTYNGVIDRSPDWLNIAIFFVSAAIAYLYETYLFNKRKECCLSPKRAIFALSVIAFLFLLFTFFTPQIGIFKDPLTGTYGL